jgi:hypothetical protein
MLPKAMNISYLTKYTQHRRDRAVGSIKCFSMAIAVSDLRVLSWSGLPSPHVEADRGGVGRGKS